MDFETHQGNEGREEDREIKMEMKMKMKMEMRWRWRCRELEGEEEKKRKERLSLEIRPNCWLNLGSNLLKKFADLPEDTCWLLHSCSRVFRLDSRPSRLVVWEPSPSPSPSPSSSRI